MSLFEQFSQFQMYIKNFYSENIIYSNNSSTVVLNG